MDYHGRIMNIAASLETIERHLLARPDTAYRIGHRDARHAAAEIALEADAKLAAKEAKIARLREALANLAAYPLEEFGIDETDRDNKRLFGANDWRLVVGDVRAARAALAPVEVSK